MFERQWGRKKRKMKMKVNKKGRTDMLNWYPFESPNLSVFDEHKHLLKWTTILEDISLLVENPCN